MKTKSLLLIVGTLTLAAGVALASRALMRPPPPVTVIKEVPVERAPARLVLAAAHPLAPGDFINGPALSWRETQADQLRANHFVANNDAERQQLERLLYGATLRRAVAADEPLTRDLLVHAGEPGFLAAVLSPGMRAVSIPTSTVASNAGLVSAGDWVDVILILSRDSTANPGATDQPLTRLASQTILRRVRVLALNNSTASITPPAVAEDVEDAASRPAGNRPARNGGGGNSSGAMQMAFQSMTLEVTPAAAERLAVVREVGTLQIALRGVRDGENTAGQPTETAPRSVTRLVDATDVLGATHQAAAAPVTVKTYQGAQQSTLSFGGTP